MAKIISVVCLVLVSITSVSMAQQQLVEKLGKDALQNKVPDQKEELLNQLVSKTWIVFRNPGSASSPFDVYDTFGATTARDVNHIDHVWKFGYGEDANDNKRVILCVDKNFFDRYHGKRIRSPGRH